MIFFFKVFGRLEFVNWVFGWCWTRVLLNGCSVGVELFLFLRVQLVSVVYREKTC